MHLVQGSCPRRFIQRGLQRETSYPNPNGVVQADFSFFDPKPNDFLVAKTLLQTYLDDQEWDLIAFVDLILAQTTVGSVVKIEDDDDEGLFEHKCIATVKDFLLLKARRQEKGVDDRLRLLLGEQARDVGLLVLWRMLNLPPSFCHLFMMSFLTKCRGPRNMSRWKSSKIPSKQKRKQSIDSDEAIIYIKLEDEIFHKLSSWSLCFPLQSQQFAPHEASFMFLQSQLPFLSCSY
ncbi:Protein BCCIP [Glycine max]|nr:Protein BCCIP [Glycine max]